ncbi:alpha/beta fold hydrolase [Sporichthya sp.]|uniref:alpha/beta hydrolase family protein n=1 Tax=Sporichthya sp. TaxID=65475 RepID=UPI00185D43F4|nr:alpha/beta fold hydrolase [Sporichthya sp.]MBA3741564.1 alpha/beta fold hydrolase [Sporichthya sp.]
MLHLRAVLCAALLAGLIACTGDGAEPGLQPDRSVPVSASPTSAPIATAGLPEVTDELSLPALMREKFVPARLRVVSELGRNAEFIRSRVSYRSGNLTISGMLLRPRGEGPFPGIVLNHGYIDPSIYVNGQGLRREQERLVRAGFVVLHTDYRGHADSDAPEDAFDRESRIGYTEDSINAVLALKQESYVDPERMAMFGRSMGGAVTLNALVVYPGLVQAAVIYSSVSSEFVENVEHFTRPSRPQIAKDFYNAFGLPELSPEFYAGLSARTYFDRITEPIQLNHGSEDGTCPYRWSTATQQRLAQAGVDSELIRWPGEDHAFYATWAESMDRSIEFLRERLRV